MKTKRILATFVVALLSTTALLAKDIRTALFKVPEMHCAKCEKKIQDAIRFEKGVKRLSADSQKKLVTITYDAEKNSVENFKKRFLKLHYEVELVKETKGEEAAPSKNSKKADKNKAADKAPKTHL